jgi:mRNA-degrading endonuclease RelE of RelBE toxin-antitoxin system
MASIVETKDFLKLLLRLPKRENGLYLKQKAIFRLNWLDPRLHAKRIKEMSGVYSFRVTRRYRVLFYFQNATAIFFYIGHRKDAYQD